MVDFPMDLHRRHHSNRNDTKYRPFFFLSRWTHHYHKNYSSICRGHHRRYFLGMWLHGVSDEEYLKTSSQNIMCCYETYLHLTGGEFNLKNTLVYQLVRDKSDSLSSFHLKIHFQPTIIHSSERSVFLSNSETPTSYTVS